VVGWRVGNRLKMPQQTGKRKAKGIADKRPRESIATTQKIYALPNSDKVRAGISTAAYALKLASVRISHKAPHPSYSSLLIPSVGKNSVIYWKCYWLKNKQSGLLISAPQPTGDIAYFNKNLTTGQRF
jgi:hypothetical protein